MTPTPDQLTQYGHRQVNQLVRQDTEIAQAIFNLFPGESTPTTWAKTLNMLDNCTQTLADFTRRHAHDHDQ